MKQTIKALHKVTAAKGVRVRFKSDSDRSKGIRLMSGMRGIQKFSGSGDQPFVVDVPVAKDSASVKNYLADKFAKSGISDYSIELL